VLQEYKIQHLRLHRSCFMSVTLYSFSLISTATDIQNCVTSLVSNVYNAFTDLMNLNSLATQLQQEVQALQNPFNILNFPALIANITSQAIQIASSVPNDISTLTTAIPNALTQIPSCVAPVETTAAQQLNAILASVQSCIQSSG